MKSLYRPLLNFSWNLNKKYKKLWLLGIFASIFNNYEIFKIPYNFNITTSYSRVAM